MRFRLSFEAKQSQVKLGYLIQKMDPKIKRFILFITFSLILTLAASGCAAKALEATPESSPTYTIALEPTATIDWFPRTPTPSQTPIITPQVTSQPENLPPGISKELIRDDFSDTNLWTTIESPAGNIAFGNNMLSLAVAGSKGTLVSISKHFLPSDFYMEMTVNVALCSDGDQYGISFWRVGDAESHRLLLTCEGNLRLEKLDSGSGAVLHDWERISRFMPGSPAQHRIGIWASQGEIRIFINGNYQISAKTTKDLSGGLGVNARAGGDNAETIVFSDLVIYQVEPGEY